MNKIWKTIKDVEFNSMEECVQLLKKKNYIVSHWIVDIAKRSNASIQDINFPVELIRIKVSELGFNNPTTLKEIYTKLDENNLKPVHPLIAIGTRLFYDTQPKGEWLRIAVPLESMIDSDGIPHLPKLGQGLNLLFIETYWSYPGAVFHPHNDFLFQKKNDF
jgi:hypothetical protein|tara:strand:- start:947 stop:1432 length:486 start_codon:yes stop_codon:yes gene_type:complete